MVYYYIMTEGEGTEKGTRSTEGVIRCLLPRDYPILAWLYRVIFRFASSTHYLNKQHPGFQSYIPGSYPMATGITPPGSVLERPLTPPPTAEKPLSKSAQSVVTCLRLYRAGHRSRFWWEGRLRPDDYTEVLQVLDFDESLRDYVEDKVR